MRQTAHVRYKTLGHKATDLKEKNSPHASIHTFYLEARRKCSVMHCFLVTKKL